VGLIARGKEALKDAKCEIEEAGGKAILLPTDVADAEGVEAAAQKVEEKFGPIDIWVNNAMCSVFSPVKQMTPAEYKRVTEVTYLGYVYGTLAALRRMLPRDRGSIVQVGSALAYRSIPLQSAYCAAKHAIIGFTDSLRCELHHDKSNVKLSVVQLPALNTTQFGWVKNRLPHKAQPVPPIYQPEVAARAIYHAAHNPRREYWLGWSTAAAIVGQRIAPGILDRYLGDTGYDSQQTSEGRDPKAPNNLWKPVPGDRGAHGGFDNRASTFSTEWWFSKNRATILAGTALAAAGILSWLARVESVRIKTDIDEIITHAA
jgi:short-subunit dehydrogenase